MKQYFICCYSTIYTKNKKKQISFLYDLIICSKPLILYFVKLIVAFISPLFEKVMLHMIKARAHKGGVRIGKTPKKLASICCP
jgi:hypothetical protein